MIRDDVRRLIENTGILPAIRVPSADDALFAAAAIYHGGIPVVELTMTVPGALDVLTKLKRIFPDLVVGAGTITDLDTAERCVDAGAAFLSSPGLDIEIVKFGIEHGVAAIPGALTPTEVMMADRAGADIIKIFPSAQVGGPSYIKALRAPFPHVRLLASGGVNQMTAQGFLLAGAVALGIRQELIPHQAVARRNEDWILELAGRFLEIVRKTREQTAA